MALEVQQVYRYSRPSSVGSAQGRTEMLLATSGGSTPDGAVEHPQFFDGFLEHPEQSATGLLAVAAVARTRFYLPPGMLQAVLRAADPVVTSNGDRLRFESFSACCGVYARLDVLADGLDRAPLGTGTTNVDVNPPLRAALAKVAGTDPVHLRVGEDVTVTTLDETVVERKVELPHRWVKGFAEVQQACAGLSQQAEVSGQEARRFVESVSSARGGRSAATWAVPAGRGLRLTGRPGPGAVPVPGPDRLRVLRPLLRHATSLRAYAQADPSGAGPGACAWEVELKAGRAVVVLSPEPSRGFSGEGGLLYDLSDETAAEDARLLAALLSFEPRLDLERLARDAGLPDRRVRRALAHLGAAGRVGFDLHDGAYFHRELPFDPTAFEAMNPRLRDARQLVAEGAVRMDGGSAFVRSGGSDQVVRRDDEGDHCTCAWWGRHRGGRGPCKHVLAVHIVRAGLR